MLIFCTVDGSTLNCEAILRTAGAARHTTGRPKSHTLLIVMAITAAEPPAHYNTSLDGPITETEAPMVDYGTGSFTIANVGNPAKSPDDEGPEESVGFVFERIHFGSGNDDVFQWNPGDSNTVEDHDAGAGASIRDGTSNTVLLAEDHLPAVPGIGTPTDTDWLLV